jgi:NAD(P)-dependent dehydrogenase (short-subunit alcohol dehydrogenase family)
VTSKLFDLTGRAALITGGSRGLGRAMAICFAAAGADVMVSSRHEDELRQAVADIRRNDQRRVFYCVADMTQRDDVKRLAETALHQLGHIDILVNNAGANLPQAIDETTDDLWDKIVQLNLWSCMALTRELVPAMKRRRWGRIIHISSMMAFASRPGRGSYSATKAALIGMARAHALDLGKYNITVNCLAPGPFLTEMADTVLTAQERILFAERTAVGRWGQPSELTGPALLLASDAGSFITGATLVVDGGALCKTF